MAQAQIAALRDATALDHVNGDASKAVGSYHQSAFMMLRGDGTVISSDRLVGFEAVLKPMAGGHCYPGGYAGTVQVHLTSDRSYNEATPAGFQPPTGRTVAFLRRFEQITLGSNPMPSDCLTPDNTVTTYVLPACHRPRRRAAGRAAAAQSAGQRRTSRGRRGHGVATGRGRRGGADGL
jgi:hypothetical protein